MNNFKKIALGLVGAALLSTGLYSCSNDDDATVSNTVEQTNSLKERINYDDNEQIRLMLATGMAEFVDVVKPVHTDGISYKDFLNKLGVDENTLPLEGGNLLQTTYSILEKKETRETIINHYSGIEFGTALIYQEEIKKANPDATGAELFGRGSSLVTLSSKGGGCSWWQIGCHIDNAFGDGTFKQGLEKVVVFLCKTFGGRDCEG